MAKYIAEIQDASGNTVYPATQWGAITNPPTIPDLGNYYNKAEVDTKLKSLIVDTGWVKVTGMNGWKCDISVRLRDGVIYHKGNFSSGGAIGAISATVFKYPDSFGDMSSFNQFNGSWAAITSDGQTDYGFIKGATKEFFCWMKGTGGEASVSNIVFRL